MKLVESKQKVFTENDPLKIAPAGLRRASHYRIDASTETAPLVLRVSVARLDTGG